MLLLAAGALACSCNHAETVAARRTIRITTGLPGMTFKPLGEALVGAYANLLPDVHFQVVETAGSVSNIQHLEAGEAELGLALADVAYTAYSGRGGEFPTPARGVRALAVLHPSAVHVLVPAGSPVHSIAELRGRIGVGPSGSGTAVTSALLLNAFGVRPDLVTNKALPFITAADALSTGGLDAAFVVAADPVDAVLRATTAGARLLDISGEQVQRLRAEYPFLRPGTIPAGTYPGEPQAVQTMLVDVLLLTREGVDEALVRRLTNALFDVLPELAAKNDFLRLMDPQRAPATPIPLHSGAALYYRERELSR
jgi:TRAP transporter TAXI family solute receptor